MTNCYCCNSTEHTLRNCTSTIMLEKVRNFETEMDTILRDDILTNESYRLTPSNGAFMKKYSICRLQRILIVLQQKNECELQTLISGYVPGIEISDLNKYTLVACLAHHYVNNSITRHLTIDEDVALISQVFLRYINRAWVDKIPIAINNEQLFQEIINDSVVIDQLDSMRRLHLQNINRAWNDKTIDQRHMFLYNGTFVIINPGEDNVDFHRFFGNVKIAEIVSMLPFRNIFVEARDGLFTQNRLEKFRRMMDAFYIVKFFSDENFESTQTCPICYETTCNAYTGCKHEFCIGCIRRHVVTCSITQKQIACPMCREKITQVFVNCPAITTVVDLTV